jgi:hypothetical protein
MGDLNLEMKYHPANKEVVLQRFQNGKLIDNDSDGDIVRYMNKRSTGFF